jgi:CRP-like cAMP-binding protein
MSAAGTRPVSYAFLKKTSLFRGITEEELPKLLDCIEPAYRDFSKNEIILRQGEDITSVGLVLSGRMQIIEEDFWGNRNIIADIWPGESLANPTRFTGELLRESAVAAENSSILMIDARHMLEICSSACRFHTRLVQNILRSPRKKPRAHPKTIAHEQAKPRAKNCFPTFPAIIGSGQRPV